MPKTLITTSHDIDISEMTLSINYNFMTLKTLMILAPVAQQEVIDPNVAKARHSFI